MQLAGEFPAVLCVPSMHLLPQREDDARSEGRHRGKQPSRCLSSSSHSHIVHVGQMYNSYKCSTVPYSDKSIQSGTRRASQQPAVNPSPPSGPRPHFPALLRRAVLQAARPAGLCCVGRKRTVLLGTERLRSIDDGGPRGFQERCRVGGGLTRRAACLAQGRSLLCCNPVATCSLQHLAADGWRGARYASRLGVVSGSKADNVAVVLIGGSCTWFCATVTISDATPQAEDPTVYEKRRVIRPRCAYPYLWPSARSCNIATSCATPEKPV